MSYKTIARWKRGKKLGMGKVDTEYGSFYSKEEVHHIDCNHNNNNKNNLLIMTMSEHREAHGDLRIMINNLRNILIQKELIIFNKKTKKYEINKKKIKTNFISKKKYIKFKLEVEQNK